MEFLHYVRDMRQKYSSSRVVLFPSLYEGYGMVAVEPMFVGTPVVSSNRRSSRRWAMRQMPFLRISTPMKPGWPP